MAIADRERKIMKRKALVFSIILSLILAACGSSASTAAAQNSAGGGTPNGVALGTSYDNAASVELQLLAGTMKLEGTNLAVTADQAAILLPLWKQVQSLGQDMGPGQGGPSQTQDSATPAAASAGSDTQTQIDGLLNQIQAAMNAEQIQAIAEMQITQDSILSVMQTKGSTMGGNGGPGGNGQAPQGTPPAGGEGNGQPAQVTPPAGGGGNGGALQGTPPAGSPSMQGGGMEMILVNALIQLLQNRIAGTSALTGSATRAAASGSTAAVYILNGGTDSQTGKTYSASGTDQSAIYVENGGRLTMGNAIVVTTGNSSSNDQSSFVGLNAAVLAAGSGRIDLSDSQVTTSGDGANGVFSTGANSLLNFSRGKITATGDGAHAAMATQSGTMILTDVDMDTSGASASAVATDRGGGTITVVGGNVHTSGMNSAGIYSTGSITATKTVFVSDGAEAAVIEGANSITLTDASLTSNKAGKWGVMIYQSMSGDAQGSQGTFTMTGGTLAYTAADGPLFYVTNTTAVILLKGVALTDPSGILVKAYAGNWGNTGANGGTVLLIADGQVLSGSLVADAISAITLTLQNSSTLTGAINADRTAKAANLTLDQTSTWVVTANSYLDSLSDVIGISGSTVVNITGNGHTVYYNANLAANSYLGGKTYDLVGGGTLKPIS